MAMSRKDRSRAAILAAAPPLLITHGSAAITMERIAREAGVAPRTLFNHFPTRGELMAAVAHERAIAVAEFIDSTRVRKPSALMRALADRMVDAGYTQGQHYFEFLAEITRNSATADTVRSGVIGQALQRFAQRSLPPGPHADVVADLLGGAMVVAVSNLAAERTFDVIESLLAQGTALDVLVTHLR